MLQRLMILCFLLMTSPAWAMEHYTQVLFDNKGNAIKDATVYVYNSGTTTPATLYSDNGITAKANPFTTSSASSSPGAYDFYAADGVYDIVFSKTGYTFNSVLTRRISLFDGTGGGGGGTSVSIDGVSVTAPNFTSTGDIDFIAVGSTVTANVNADSVALGTDTTGNYLSSATGSQGLTVVGTEGASIGLQPCINGQILKNSGGTSWICSADSTGGSPTFDTIASGTNTTMAAVVSTGASLTPSGSGSIVATSLAANGANCSAGSGALGVDTAGAAESCTDFMEEPSSTGLVARTAANTASGRTITGTANAIAVTNGNGVSGNPTLDLSPVIDATSKTVRIPNSTTLPATCTTGDQYMDTDATTGQRYYLCESANTWVKQGDGGGGSGTVTNTGGNLTSNAIVLGAGTVDTKVVTGIVTDGASKVTLGVAGSSIGSVAMNNATSGTITVSPVTGALGTVAIALPAQAGTVVVGALGATANVIPVASGTGGSLLAASGCSIASSTITCPNGFTSSGAGVGTLAMLEGTAPGAHATASTHNLYINSTGSVLETHENGGSVKTYLYSGGALGTPSAGVATNLTGTAASLTAGLATALAANGGNCSAGSYPLGVGADGAVESCTALASESVTYTNKVYNAASTGNDLTIKQERVWDTAGCVNTTAGSVFNLPVSNPAVATCDTGANIQSAYMAFNADTDQAFEGRLKLQTGFTGSIDWIFDYKMASATTGAIGWCVQMVRVLPGTTAEDPAYPAQASGNCVSDTVPGTAGLQKEARITAATCTSCAAGDTVYFRVSRDANGGAVTDSATGNGELLMTGPAYAVVY